MNAASLPAPTAFGALGYLLAAIACAVPAASRPARADEEERARSELRRSWEQACARYDERIDWSTRQACNLAWFRAHERDVWQHNLNPHGPPMARPSS